MKVKAKVSIGDSITVNKIYDVTQEGEDTYTIILNDGTEWVYWAYQFEPVSEAPQIEVGSEWVSEMNGNKDKTLKVLTVGKHLVFSEWSETGKEFTSPLSTFNSAYKPKLKTVTMYFYESMGRIQALDYMTHAPLLFTREIEL